MQINFSLALVKAISNATHAPDLGEDDQAVLLDILYRTLQEQYPNDSASIRKSLMLCNQAYAGSFLARLASTKETGELDRQVARLNGIAMELLRPSTGLGGESPSYVKGKDITETMSNISRLWNEMKAILKITLPEATNLEGQGEARKLFETFRDGAMNSEIKQNLDELVEWAQKNSIPIS